MRKTKFNEYLEFLDIDRKELCELLGSGTERCPPIDIATCEDLDCFSCGNTHCWEKYLDDNLEG